MRVFVRHLPRRKKEKSDEETADKDGNCRGKDASRSSSHDRLVQSGISFIEAVEVPVES
jgi:hypothetical protein